MIVSKTSAEGFLGKKLDGLGGGRRSYYVLSADGTKNLGGPYTKPQATKRLQQVEFFKRRGNPRKKFDIMTPQTSASNDIHEVVLGNKAVALVWDPSDKQVVGDESLQDYYYGDTANAKMMQDLIRYLSGRGGGVIQAPRGKMSREFEKKRRREGKPPLKINEVYIYGPGYKRHAKLLAHMTKLQESGEFPYKKWKRETDFVAQSILGWKDRKDPPKLSSAEKTRIYKKLTDWGFADVITNLERGDLPKEKAHFVRDSSGELKLVRNPSRKKKSRSPNPRKTLYIKPNESAKKVAGRALERRKKLPRSKRGGLDAMQAHEEGVGSGVMRARDIASGKRINAYQVKAFFDRHRGNYVKAKADGKRWEDSKAWQAWDLWGGEPLRKQVEAAVRRDNPKGNPRSKYDAFASDIAREVFLLCKEIGIFKAKSRNIDKLKEIVSPEEFYIYNLGGIRVAGKPVTIDIGLGIRNNLKDVMFSGAFDPEQGKLMIFADRPHRLKRDADMDREYMLIYEIVRHELEHAAQDIIPGSDRRPHSQRIRSVKDFKEAFLDPHEIEAYATSFYARSKKLGLPFDLELGNYKRSLMQEFPAIPQRYINQFASEVEKYAKRRYPSLSAPMPIPKRGIKRLKRRGNPNGRGPEKILGPEAGRIIYKAMKGKRRFTVEKAAKETGMGVPTTQAGLDWLVSKGFATHPDHAGKYKLGRKNPGEPQENPKPFEDRPHDWNEVLISNGKKQLTRRQILNYYKRNEDKIWPFLEGQTVMVVLAVKKNVFIRRRHEGKKDFIKITKKKGMDDPRSFEYWINRRVVEFHPTLTTKTTPILWLDLDIHSTKNAEARKKLLGKMRRAMPTLKKVFKEMGVKRVHVYSSGTEGGYHLEGGLEKPKNVDALRRRLTKRLKEVFADDEMFTTGIAKSGQIRLDTTTLHKLGSLRAPYSLTVNGTAKKPVK